MALFLLMLLVMVTGGHCRAGDDGSAPLLPALESEVGGHLKARGAAFGTRSGTLLGVGGTRNGYDGSLEGRLKGAFYWGPHWQLDVHYEVLAAGGDTRRQQRRIADLLTGGVSSGELFAGVPEDDRRLMDLTGILTDTDDRVVYHRLDRLALTYAPSWGVIRLGRQAVTWGNGLLFNPMDLFNPFAPTDIERDYKIGDDMISLQLPLNVVEAGNLHLLHVPRRDPDSGELQGNQNSTAARLHFSRGETEIDLMAAAHYRDHVLGLGSVGYLGDAAWRFDVTYTLSDGTSEDYLSLVANLDYAWEWWGRNFYGFAEVFYNGLGTGDYSGALSDPQVVERRRRGELFVLGRPYVSGHVRMEAHPLLNVFLTVITNVNDPSGILQPRAVWDVTQEMQVVMGANISYGGRGTEFGGVVIPGTGLSTRGADSVFGWLYYFF